MSAPAGNTYAEKWTLERTTIALHTIDRFSQDPDYLYLGHALDAAGLYDDVWRYWRRKWKKRYEILDLMKKIMQRFEVRIFQKMAKKEIPERVGMFALRHHYGWGREPENHTYEDCTYLDLEPVVDKAPAPIAPPPAELAPAELTPAEIEAGMIPFDPDEIYPMYDADFSFFKKLEYNMQHPDNPILTEVCYFDGQPPEGRDYIPCGKGYFLEW